MRRLSEKRRRKAEDILDAARDAQAEFWRSLSQLESYLRIEIESIIDLRDVSLEDLLDPERTRAILGRPERNTVLLP